MKILDLMEGATFYPSEKTVSNGEIFYGWPKSGTRKVKDTCPYCDEGVYHYVDHPDVKCDFCDGSGECEETVYDFPNLDVSYGNLRIILQMLGLPDDGDGSGDIPHNEIPIFKRRLIQLMNQDVSDYTRDTTDRRETRVDRFGDIPKISSGPRMIDFGVDTTRLKYYMDKLMEIFDYAQKHGLHVTWA